MWTYVKFILGLSLISTSLMGSTALFDGTLEESALRIAENGVDTEGVIESTTRTFVAARYGKVGGFTNYYTMKYRFTTHDGRTLSQEINISKQQANRARDGQKITVRYYRDQPTINSPLGFEEYMTRKDAKNLPYGTMIATSIMMFLGGAWLTWANWRRIRPGQANSVGTSRMAAARAAGIAGPSGPPASPGPGAVARSGGFGRR